MTRATGLDYAVMFNLANKHTHTHTATRKQGGEHKVLRAQVGIVQVDRVCPLCRA